MPILGIVLSLDADSPEADRRTIDRLRAVPNLELGERQDAKQPAVLECVDDRKSNGRVEAEIGELLAIEGVVHVDVVFAEFADLLPETESIGTTPTAMERESWT